MRFTIFDLYNKTLFTDLETLFHNRSSELLNLMLNHLLKIIV